MATWAQALGSGENASRIRKFMFGSLIVQDYVASAASGFAASGWTPFGSDGSFQGTSPGASGSSGWTDLGFISTDGVQVGRDISGDDVMGWQSRSSLRHDVTSDVLTLQFTALETKPSVLAIVNNLPLSAVTSPAASGTNFARPQAVSVYRSWLLYGADGTGSQANYAAILLPYASVTDVSEVTLSPGDPVQYQVTVTSYVDQYLQSDSRWVLDGPAYRSQTTNI